MKNRSTRTVLFVFLVCLSLASYLYMNLAARSEVSAATEQMDAMDEEAQDGHSVPLPDVRMLRTVIETGKRILPAS